MDAVAAADGLPDHAACYGALARRDADSDGLFFACVVSTGIYCRPVCRARLPAASGVRFVASAADAEADGYRPCLLCSPERAPRPGWHPGLAGRTSRDDAHTARALLARQLLRETDLPEAAVAQAAGYDATAAMRAAILRSGGESARALRRRRRRAAPADGSIRLRLDFRPPLDWDFFLDFHRARAIPGLETIARRRYRRVVAGEPQPTVIDVAPGRGNWLELAVYHATPTALPQIIEATRRAFDLDAHPALLQQAFRRDPILGDIARRRPGVRVAGVPDPFEQAVRAILGQQVSVVAARDLGARLCQRWGRALAAAPWPQLSHAFPTPEVLATADVASLGMPRARGRAVNTLARACLVDPTLLQPAAAGDGVGRLLELKGIGDWTANYVAMRAQRDPDAFPAGDVGLQRALADGSGARPNTRELHALAERWRPLRAYAAQYLWLADAPAWRTP